MGFLLSIATRQCDMLEIFYLSARSFTAKKDCPDLGGGVDPCAVPLDLRLVQDTRDEKKPLIVFFIALTDNKYDLEHCASGASAKIFASYGSKNISEMCPCPDLGVRRAPLAPHPRYAPGAKYLNLEPGLGFKTKGTKKTLIVFFAPTDTKYDMEHCASGASAKIFAF